MLALELGPVPVPVLGEPPGVVVMVGVVDGVAVTVTVEGDAVEVVGDPEVLELAEVLEPVPPEELGEPEVEDELGEPGEVEAEVEVLEATVSLSELLAVPLDGAPQAPRAVTETRQRGRKA